MEFPQRMEKALGELCDHCHSGEGCEKEKCLAGFSQRCLESYLQGNGPRIENGLERIPTGDLKVYDREDAALIIAIACKWCHDCENDHSEDCVVSLCRRAMEFGITGDEITYKGNGLAYLKELGEMNAEFCGLVMDHYRQLK